MSNIAGIHLQGYTDAYEVASVGFGCYVVLDIDGIQIVSDLRAYSSDAVILVRVYERDIIQRNPESWADYCASVYYHFRPWTRHITPANETNIEGGSRDANGYAYLNSWMLRWYNRFRPQCPDAIVHFPAISPSPTEHLYVYQYCSQAVEICDVLDVHTYWTAYRPVQNAASEYFLARNYFPHKWAMITEYNRIWNHASYADGVAYGEEVIQFINLISRDTGLIGAASFLWSTPDPAHYQMTWRAQPVADIVTRMHKPESNWKEPLSLYGLPGWVYLLAGGVLLSILI